MQFSISMKISGNLVMSSLEVIVKFYKRKEMAICSVFLFWYKMYQGKDVLK